MSDFTDRRSGAWLLAMGVAVTLSISLFSSPCLLAQEGSRSSGSSAKKSPSKTEEADIEKRLKEILKNQEQILANQSAILQKFDAVMEELRIIKVRATIRGGS